MGNPLVGIPSQLLGYVDSGVPSGTLTWWLGVPTEDIATDGQMCEEPMSPFPCSSSSWHRENVDSEIGRHRRLFPGR